MTICIKNDEKDNEVDCVTRVAITRRGLQCNKVIQGAAKTVI